MTILNKGLSNLLEDVSSSSVELHDYGVHFLSGEIDVESSSEAIKFILEANLSDNQNYDHLTLIVNSPGGTFEDGFALIDIMQGSKLPVRTVGIGIIASMGLLIFLNGKKGCRILTPNTLIMSHQWGGISIGKEHELVASHKEHDIITNIVLRHYKKNTNLKEKDIRKYLLPPHDVWLTAQEALQMGICDDIKLV